MCCWYSWKRDSSFYYLGVMPCFDCLYAKADFLILHLDGNTAASARKVSGYAVLCAEMSFSCWSVLELVHGAELEV